MLDVAGLSAGYGNIPVLDDVRLTVAAGTCVAVFGPNGTGKTTLLKALMGLIPARAGRLSLAGRDMRPVPTHERSRAGMAYVPQGRGIFPALTVRENLALGALVRRGSPPEAVAAALARFPLLGPLADRAGGALSGGEQQVLALARALCAQPRLLLLDEPTEGIQPSIVDTLADTLASLVAEGLAVLLVEQNLDFVDTVADSAVVMDRGRLAAGDATDQPRPDADGHPRMHRA